MLLIKIPQRGEMQEIPQRGEMQDKGTYQVYESKHRKHVLWNKGACVFMIIAVIPVLSFKVCPICHEMTLFHVKISVLIWMLAKIESMFLRNSLPWTFMH